MEMGQDAGRITWDNAMDNCASDNPDADGALLADEEGIAHAREWAAAFGAWDEDEIASWSAQEVNALVLQYIAGDIREAMPDLVDDYDAYERDAQAGRIGGNIFRDEDNQFWFYLGN